MGGEVSRETFARSSALSPQHPGWFREPTRGLYGFGLPFLSSQLETLAMRDPPMTHLVTMLEEPLKNGRNNNGAEWHCGPVDLLDSTADRIEKIHIPIADGGVPTLEQTCDFIRLVRRVIVNGGGVGIHCWMGRGRTGALLGAYLIAEAAATGKWLTAEGVRDAVWPFSQEQGISREMEAYKFWERLLVHPADIAEAYLSVTMTDSEIGSLMNSNEDSRSQGPREQKVLMAAFRGGDSDCSELERFPANNVEVTSRQAPDQGAFLKAFYEAASVQTSPASEKSLLAEIPQASRIALVMKAWFEPGSIEEVD